MRPQTSSSAHGCSTRTNGSACGISPWRRESGSRSTVTGRPTSTAAIPAAAPACASPGGHGVEYDSRADDVHLHEIDVGELVVHDFENVGDAVLSFTTVELLERA